MSLPCRTIASATFFGMLLIPCAAFAAPQPSGKLPPITSNANTYNPIKLDWETVTLSSSDFDKLVKRCNGDPDTLAAQLVKSKARDISSTSVLSYDTRTATISQTSDVPYSVTDDATGKQATEYTPIGQTATIQIDVIAPDLVSASISYQDSEIVSWTNGSGLPPTVQTISTQTRRTLTVNHPILVNNLAQVDTIAGKVRLSVITAHFIPQDLEPSL